MRAIGCHDGCKGFMKQSKLVTRDTGDTVHCGRSGWKGIILTPSNGKKTLSESILHHTPHDTSVHRILTYDGAKSSSSPPQSCR